MSVDLLSIPSNNNFRVDKNVYHFDIHVGFSIYNLTMPGDREVNKIVLKAASYIYHLETFLYIYFHHGDDYVSNDRCREADNNVDNLAYLC